MIRPTTFNRWLSIALGCGLALPATFADASPSAMKQLASAQPGQSSTLAQLAEADSVIDTWRDYALSTLKAEFSWASEPGETVEIPTVFNRGRPGIARNPALRFPGTLVQSHGPLEIAMQTTRAGNTPLYAPAEGNSLLQDHSPGLRRTVIAPSFTQYLGDNGFLSVSAILAYERFAGFDIGFSSAAPKPTYEMDSSSNPSQLRNHGTAAGAGARVDFGNNIFERVTWQAGYQSRVNMDGFNTAEGFYARRTGMFDIPASMNLGLNFRLSREFQADIGVERVMYGDIPPYISTELPPQLLLQLGSYRNTSLVWENLIVRSAGLSWHDDTIGDLRFGVTTRQQPLPTLPLLQRALESNLSAHSFEFSYAHLFGRSSTLRFLGVYAPAQLLGAPTANYILDGTSGLNRLRVEAMWTSAF
ncbi:MAG: hypothetical protein ABI846_02055 [Rudaea sp.]